MEINNQQNVFRRQRSPQAENARSTTGPTNHNAGSAGSVNSGTRNSESESYSRNVLQAQQSHFGIDQRTGQLMESVRVWVANSPQAERYNREIAQSRIVNYVRNGERGALNLIGLGLSSLPENFGDLHVGLGLYLSNNQLTSLPENFGDLHVGQGLYLSNNQLTSLPESFCNLHVGQRLNLGNNRLTSLPDNFENLVSNTVNFTTIFSSIDLTQNSFPPQVATNINNQFRNNRVPIHLSIQENTRPSIPAAIANRVGPTMTNPSSLDQLVQALKDLAKRYQLDSNNSSNSEMWTDLNNDSESDNFKTFLNKIWKTKDAGNEVTLQVMLKTLMTIFHKMENNPGYVNQCLVLAEESITTCGDRVALGLVQMQIAAKNYSDTQPSLNTLFDLAKIQIKLDVVYSLAENKVATMRGSVDPVETYLFYFVNLQNDLGLDMGGMLYPSMANVNETDLSKAKYEFTKITEDQVYERLLDNPTVQARFQDAFAQVMNQDKYADTMPDSGEPDSAYMQRMDVMTNHIIQDKIAILRNARRKHFRDPN